MTPDEFVERFRSDRASAILRTHHHELARNAMEAAIEGGFRIVEFTLSIPDAFSLIEQFSCRSDLIVGAGTVLTVSEAREAVRAGARFLVSPVVDVEVIEEAKALGVAAMPGCSTPTEMLQAHRCGAQLQKLFPEQGAGPAWVKQVLGPLPFLRIVPTAGVTRENAAEFLRAGSTAVGFVNALFDPGDIAREDWGAITQRAAAMRAAVMSP